MLALLLSTLAFGQSIDLDASIALTGQPGTFTERGVGAPTVTWDPNQERYLMFFESQLTDPDTLCPQGRWAIGLAYSENGSSWTMWPDPIVEPTAGTPYSCYAAHPAVARDDDGSIHLWFKAGQQTDACDAGTPAWGCKVHPGISKVAGVAQVLDDVSDEIAEKEARLVQIQIEREQEMDAMASTVTTLLGLLETSSPLQCHNDYPSLCAPCPSLTLEATFDGAPGFDTRYLCQAFVVDVPRELPVIDGNAGPGANRSYIRYSDDASLDTHCWYKGNNTYYDLHAQGHCVEPISPHAIQLEVNDGATPIVTVRTELSATNVQTLQGTDVDILQAYGDSAAAYDQQALYDNAAAVQQVLDDLQAWLDTQPASAEVNQLWADVEDSQALIDDHIAVLQALDAEQAAVEAQLDYLYNYEQNVELLPSGPELQIDAVRAAYPSVSKVEGVWRMLFTYKRKLVGATSTDGDNWTYNLGAAAVPYGTVPWTSSEVFAPSLNCNDELGPDRHVAFYGGRETSTGIPGDPIVTAGFGDAISSDFTTWLEATSAWFTWSTNWQWRHWDMLGYGDGTWRVMMSWLTVDGPVIQGGKIGATPSGVPAAHGRICQ